MENVFENIKQEEKEKKIDIVKPEFHYSLSKDGNWLITKVTFTDIKHLNYFKSMFESKKKGE